MIGNSIIVVIITITVGWPYVVSKIEPGLAMCEASALTLKSLGKFFFFFN